MTRAQRKRYSRAIASAASAIAHAPDGVDDELDSLLSNAAGALILASERLQKIAGRLASNASAAQRPPDSSVAETPEEEH